jgi:hypothetical protein
MPHRGTVVHEQLAIKGLTVDFLVTIVRRVDRVRVRVDRGERVQRSGLRRVWFGRSLVSFLDGVGERMTREMDRRDMSADHREE